MAKAQFPIDGKLGKDFKVTSYMGWRIHPTKHIKKFHTGTDIISKNQPCVIEAPYDGKVVRVTLNDVNYGNFVIIQHKIQGKYYTTLYGHMKDGSVKVKNGQKVTAGTAIGKMGTTGASTGVHLHWELCAGKKWAFSNTGKNFIEPTKFFTALIELEKNIATAPVEAQETDPVAPAPTHDEAGAKAAAKGNPVSIPEPIIKPVASQTKVRPTLTVGSKHTADVKYLQQKLKVETNGADGTFGPKTKAAVIAFQEKHGLTANGVVGPETWEKLS